MIVLWWTQAHYHILPLKKTYETKLQYLLCFVIWVFMAASVMIIQWWLLIFFWCCFAQCRHLVLFGYVQKIGFKKRTFSWCLDVPTLFYKSAELLSPLPQHQSIIFQNFFHNCLSGATKKVQSTLIVTFENLLFWATAKNDIIFVYDISLTASSANKTEKGMMALQNN